MVQNITLLRNLSLANRTAEFPGMLQALPAHTALTETLAMSILQYVQRIEHVTAHERKTEYTQRLNNRLVSRGQDASLVPEIVAIAEDLNLFD